MRRKAAIVWISVVMGTLSSCGVIGRTAAEPQTQQETGSISSKNTEVEKENAVDGAVRTDP